VAYRLVHHGESDLAARWNIYNLRMIEMNVIGCMSNPYLSENVNQAIIGTTFIETMHMVEHNEIQSQ
jgi:hypothetical protein